MFEPTGPRPAQAPLAIVMHGYFEFAGYDQMYELIRHTVRKGNVVIYPRWQTGVATPCPGPFDIEPCMTLRGATASAARWRTCGRAGAASSRSSTGRATSASRSAASSRPTSRTATGRCDLPKPRAIFLDDPHDGGLDGLGEPALDDSLAGIPRDA